MNKNFIDEELPKNKSDPAFDSADGSEPGTELTEPIESEEKNWSLIQQQAQAVSQCREWFDTDREAKRAYNAEMDEMYKLFKSDHWSLLDENGQVLRTAAQKKNHPNAVENTTFALVEGLVAEFSEGKELVDYPTEEGDDEAALVMTQLKEFIGYKNRLDIESIKWLRWFFLYGTGIWEKNWDPSWKGGKGPNRWTGDVRWKACHPRTIFPDARCLESFEDGRRLHKAIYWTIEDVEETWPDAVGISPDMISDDLLVSDELEDTSVEATEDQVLVFDTYYKGKPLILDEGEEDQGPGLHLIQWAGEGTLKYLDHQNYINFEPGEDVEFPIKGYKCYERERSPWGIGEAFYLKNPQIIKNKTAELIIEGHVFQSVGQTWYESDALSEKQKRMVKQKGSLGGMWFEVLRADGVHREYPRNIPTTLENETSRLDKVMETIIGRFDISQGKTPGSVTAFRALDLLASRAQVRLRSKETTINVAMEDCGNYINRLIQRNYNEKRKYRILGKDDSKPMWGTYDGEAMKKVYLFDTDETISMDELNIELKQQDFNGVPPDQQWQEGEQYEIYSPEFDTKCKITSKMPTDRVFYMEMAKELFASQLIDETMFYYVLEFGKFPPYEDVLRSLEAKQEQAQQMQMMQQQGGGGMPGGVPGEGEQVPPAQPQQDPNAALEQFIQMLQQKHPEVLKKLAELPKDKQVPALLELMQSVPPEMMESGAAAPQQGQAAAQLESNAGVPPEADAKRIKQELIDLLLASKEQYSTEEPQ